MPVAPARGPDGCRRKHKGPYRLLNLTGRRRSCPSRIVSATVAGLAALGVESGYGTIPREGTPDWAHRPERRRRAPGRYGCNPARRPAIAGRAAGAGGPTLPAGVDRWRPAGGVACGRSEPGTERPGRHYAVLHRP